MSRVKCFLDMDGVLIDFLSGASKAHGRELPYTKVENRGIWETEQLWGITSDAFWKPIDALGAGFWEDLPKTDECDEIISLVDNYFGLDNVAILTAPSDDPNCVIGKKLCLKKRLPMFKKRVIFTGAKEFLAGPNRVLIDDRDKNIKDFFEAGGYAIRVPRLWNMAHTQSHVVIQSIKKQLDRFNEETVIL